MTSTVPRPALLLLVAVVAPVLAALAALQQLGPSGRRAVQASGLEPVTLLPALAFARPAAAAPAGPPHRA